MLNNVRGVFGLSKNSNKTNWIKKNLCGKPNKFVNACKIGLSKVKSRKSKIDDELAVESFFLFRADASPTQHSVHLMY